MKKFLLFLGVAFCVAFSANEASAQIKLGEGQVSVALESNNSYYAKDNVLENLSKDGTEPLSSPLKRIRGDFGSNNYLKVDYNLKGLSAGIQVDAFLPALYGYDLYDYMSKDKTNAAYLSKYIQYEANNWGVRAGDIYDQFGNGLVFRSYEDRALAFNNSLFGARAYYNLNNLLNIKVLAGKPRLYDVCSDNWVYGADLSLAVSDMIGWNNGILAIEGSYVGRTNQELIAQSLDVKTLNMVSGRLNFELSGFTLRGEYATKLNNDIFNKDIEASKGNVIFLDMGYNYKRFSASASFRRIDNMLTLIDNATTGNGGGNVINYIPLLTRQHTYSLANLNPYRGAIVNTGGEIGGQVDVYYSLRNPKARGKYWNFHANFSTFNTIDHKGRGGVDMEGRNVWRDFNFDVERQWSKKLKTTVLYSYQRWDEEINHGDLAHTQYCTSHIFVGDVTYKFNKKHSVRVEAQYLASDDYEGDWIAGTIEYNFAPKFSFYISDMWNCEPRTTKAGEWGGNYFYNLQKFNLLTGEYQQEHALLHYYQIGGSYTHNSLRVQLSYGRNRAGFVCSGGVCRFQPAFTGLNLAATISF